MTIADLSNPIKTLSKTDWHKCYKKIQTFQGRLKSTHSSEALIVHCIDHRFQEAFHQYAFDQCHNCGYDNVSLAGGVKDRESVMKQVDLAVKLHDIKLVYLCNHEDCGAYQHFEDPEQEQLIHFNDLIIMAKIIKEKYPNLAIKTLYAEIHDIDTQIDDQHSVIVLDEVDWQAIQEIEIP